MKHFKFTNYDLTVNVTIKTDLIGSGQNFTILAIVGADDSIGANNDNKAILAAFKQLPSNLSTFIQFAEDNGLALTVSESNGDGSTTLVDVQDSSASF